MDNRKTNVKKDCCAFAGETKAVPVYEPKIHKFRNQRGDAVITSYSVFPGITLSFYSVHMDRFAAGVEKKGNFMEIHHCREGRMEQVRENGSVYIMPGDLSVTVKKQHLSEYSFPLCHYHGISICIDTDAAPECLSCFLKDVNVRPRELAKRLCGRENCFIIRSQAYIEHIFSELYSVPGSCRKGYFKVKILELLLVLGSVSTEKNSASALLLIHTDRAILEIAAEFGYSNAGKFAFAFHKIMGETPGEYRKIHGSFE